ncbi:MAG TPA: hypothetical protein VNO21_25570 [Polyangiaceae bacterium]|nr:hypothetical protein [Polyangiaceae bacterium]
MPARRAILLPLAPFVLPLLACARYPVNAPAHTEAPAPDACAAPSVFAPGIISGSANEASPAFTPDSRTVYFSRGNSSGSTILVSHFADGRWSEPGIAPFSGSWPDLEPAMAPDGSFMVFASSRPIREGGAPLDGIWRGETHKGRGGNLWRVARRGNAWDPPVRMSDAVNRSSSVFSPAVAGDGSLYFMDPWPASGRFRLYRSQFENGAYLSPEPLSFSSGEFSDVDPAVAPDESFLVFSSNRPPAASGDLDLFIVHRAAGRDGSKGAWGEPIRLSGDVNGLGSDIEARLSPDARTLYFSTARVSPVVFPRTRESAQRDLLRVQSWDTGQTNIWCTALEGRLLAPSTEQK